MSPITRFIDPSRLLITLVRVVPHLLPIAWLGVRALNRYDRTTIDMVYEWADENGLEIVDLAFCRWWEPPFRGPNQVSFWITVRDSSRRLRRGAIVVGSEFGGARVKRFRVAWERDRDR